MSEGRPARRIIALNIGNTNVAYALFEGRKMVWARWLPVERAREAGAAAARVKDVADAVIASVNPPCARQLAVAYRRIAHKSPVSIGKEISVPIINLTEEPERVGADRLLNALAAHRRCNGPALVADVGTAITLDLVSARGEFMGGLIAPGMRLSALALAKYTALLPQVEVRRPRGLYGRNTAEAIRSGIYWGAVAGISGVAALLREKLGDSLTQFVTGGSAALVVPHLAGGFIHAPYLTLEGIQLSYEACLLSFA